MSSKSRERKRADRIFDQWQSELTNKDRSHAALTGNFDELFQDMKYAGLEIDLAEEYLKEAIVAHYPSKYVVDLTYKKRRKDGLSKDDFYDSWKKLIEDRAKAAFYFRYPLQTEEDKPKETGSGGMSKDEYIRQRKYVQSFPSLDLSKIPDIEDDDEDSFSMPDLGE